MEQIGTNVFQINASQTSVAGSSRFYAHRAETMTNCHQPSLADRSPNEYFPYRPASRELIFHTSPVSFEVDELDDYRSDTVHFTSHSDQLPKCFDDNRKVTTRRLAVPSGKMAHGHLLDRHAKPGCLSEDLRVDHCAYRLDLDTVEDIAVESFESAINVTDPDPEHESERGCSNPTQITACGADPVAGPGNQQRCRRHPSLRGARLLPLSQTAYQRQ